MSMVQTQPLLKYVRWRIKKNKNVICVINGPTGSGKTYAAISLADQVAKAMNTNFDVETNIAFNFGNLLTKMNLPMNSAPGTPFIFEEVGSIGSGSSSRQWQSQANQFFFSFMQTARHRNQVLFLTCPNFSYLDKGCREMCHIQATMQGINFKTKIATIKPYVLQVNPVSGKIYFKYLRFTKDGVRIKLCWFDVSYPREELVKPYERMKLEFTSKLNKEIIEKGEDKIKSVSVRQRGEQLTETLTKLVKRGLTNPEIAKVLDVNVRSVLYYKKKAGLIGYKDEIPRDMGFTGATTS